MRDGLEGLCGGVLALRHGSCGERAQTGFGLGPGFLDRIEVGRVGRQVSTDALQASILSRTPTTLCALEIVHHDDVSGAQLWAQDVVEEARKTSPSVAASTVMVASMPV